MIEFKVEEQVLSLKDKEIIVSDSIKYLECDFEFSKDWDGAIKTAHFNKNGLIYNVLLTDDKILRKDNLCLESGKWKVYLSGIIGDTRITTTIEYLDVFQSGVMEGEPLPELPLSATEQMLSKINDTHSIVDSLRKDIDAGVLVGEKGEKGDMPHITIGTVETVEPSEGASITVSGTDSQPVLNFKIPKGEKGESEDLSSMTQQIDNVRNESVSKANTAVQNMVGSLTLPKLMAESVMIGNYNAADIETGTWQGASNIGSVSKCVYQRIGKLCYISFTFTNSSISTITDNIVITGLPFPQDTSRICPLGSGYGNLQVYTESSRGTTSQGVLTGQVDWAGIRFTQEWNGRSWYVACNTVSGSGSINISGVYDIKE